MLTIALTAAICGCESCVEFADFAVDREELFCEFLVLENGLPSGAVWKVVGIGGWRNLRLVQTASTGVGAPGEITP